MTNVSKTNVRAPKKRKKPHKAARWVFRVIARICAILAVLGTLARLLPAELQALPYLPNIIALSPWFALIALVSAICAIIGRAWVTLVFALACIGAQVYWQLPYYQDTGDLTQSARNGVGMMHVDTADNYARVMTCNVFKGQADPEAIVNAVHDERVEVLTLQETTPAFLKKLEDAGIGHYLPYSISASADHVYGNAIFSAVPLTDPADAELDSVASFMPAGNLGFGAGTKEVRFVSVHTTAPVQGQWHRWDRSVQQLQELAKRDDVHYVLMGDFNATTDHKVFQDLLGGRYQDAVETSGHGLEMTWPADVPWLPALSQIDHVVTEKDVSVGQVKTVKIPGSDHKALLVTLDFSNLS